MGKLFYMVKMTFMIKFAYKKAMVVNIVGIFVSIFINFYLWKFVFRNQEVIYNFDAAEMITYVVLARVLSAQFSDGINNELAQWLYEGKIGEELLRPVTLIFSLFSKRLGEFAFFILIKGGPVSILCMFLLQGKGPRNLLNLFLCFICITISVVIMFCFEFAIGLCSFYTFSPDGLAFAKTMIFSLLSGGIIPVFLMPEILSQIINYLPFSGMVWIPINIYLGKFEFIEITKYICFQILWATILYFMVKILYKSLIKKVVIQGG